MLLEHIIEAAELGCMFAATVDQVATTDLVFLWLILLEIESTCEVENRCSLIRGEHLAMDTKDLLPYDLYFFFPRCF